MAQTEMIEFGVEQGQMLQVLMRHCRQEKRQETLMRAATALLLATFFATLLWLQFHQQTTTDLGPRTVLRSIGGEHAEALRTKGSSKRQIVHLEPAAGFSCPEKHPIKWVMINNDSKNFKLKNKTILQTSTKGLYLINLMITYRIAFGQCKPRTQLEADQILTLEVNVTQWHSNYEKETVIVSGTESMLCREYWLQTLTLSRVVVLEADTRLRVRVNEESCKFISWFKNSHLDVTYL